MQGRRLSSEPSNKYLFYRIFLEIPRFETWSAGFVGLERQTPPLCYAAPPTMVSLDFLGELMLIY